MYAVCMDGVGEADVLNWKELPEPEPKEDEILVDVRAIGVNFREIYFRRGMYPSGQDFILGQEASGVVVSVGSRVDRFMPGDRVVVMIPNGAYASRLAVPQSSATGIPEEVSFEDAAAIELQGLTAHVITTSCSRIQPGDWVIVHAAAGGLGLLLTRIATHMGAYVIGSVSSDAKAPAVYGAGARVVTSYEDFLSKAKELTGGAGVAAVFDGVGAQTIEASLDALSATGTLVLYGWVSGSVKRIELDRMCSRSFVRPRLNEFLVGSELQRRLDEVFDWMRRGVVKSTVGARFPLSRAGDAHRVLESRQSTGKVLLIPDAHYVESTLT
jgi:NADPH2:quinone reductase